MSLTIEIWCRPLSQHPLTPARHQPHPLNPSAQTINQEETKNPGKRSNSQQIVLCCLSLRRPNPGLREVDLNSALREVVARLIGFIQVGDIATALAVITNESYK